MGWTLLPWLERWQRILSRSFHHVVSVVFGLCVMHTVRSLFLHDAVGGKGGACHEEDGVGCIMEFVRGLACTDRVARCWFI